MRAGLRSALQRARHLSAAAAGPHKLDAEALTLPPYDLPQAIGAKRGMLISGGEVDTERAAKMLVGEFRASKGGGGSPMSAAPRRAIQEDREEVTDDAPQDDDWDDEQ